MEQKVETPRKQPKLKRTTSVRPASAQRVLAKRRKTNRSGIYTPSVTVLKKNFRIEFNKFLYSLKKEMDRLADEKNLFMMPLERKLRVCHKNTANMQLHFKSMCHWKSFFQSFIDRCEDLVRLFRLDLIGDIDKILDDAKLPKVLYSFARENLIEWRKMFAEKPWIIEYQNLYAELEELKKVAEEEEEKSAVVRNILAGCEKYQIDIGEIAKLNFSEPQKVVEWFRKRVALAKKEIAAKDSAAKLKLLPSSSKRLNTREWCRKHHEILLASATSSSDDETSADGASSLFEEGGDTDSDISSSGDVRTHKSDNDENMDSYFALMGL